MTTLNAGIEAEFKRLDARLSNYRPDSTIEQFNRGETTAPVAVGEEIIKLVQLARQVSEASLGCYDLTIKPLFDLWGFGRNILTPPDPERIEEAMRHIGFVGVEAVSSTQLRKSNPSLQVDLSSIAQGYSVGRIAAVVEKSGIQNYLVEIGGELQTRGHKPDGSPWRIGVERPLPGGRAVQKALTIRQDAPVAVMTSGTYRHYFDSQGRRYSHVLDGRTGKPVDHDTVSVTLIHHDPTQADAWSTALLCLGAEQGLTTANRQGLAALFIEENNGQFREITSDAWRSMKEIEVN